MNLGEAVVQRPQVDLVGRPAAVGRVVGWFQGRMEFGPRALGNRSILGDPRSPRMQAQMNIKIKFREGFRPFAPSVLAERAEEYFALGGAESPYMLVVAPVPVPVRVRSSWTTGPPSVSRIPCSIASRTSALLWR